MKFQEVSTIASSSIQQFLNGQSVEKARVEHIRQAMDIIQKSALLAIGMQTFGPSPRAFYFGEDEQLSLLSRNLQSAFTNSNSSEAPMIGIKQAIRFCADGNIYVSTDSVVDYFNREFQYQHSGGRGPRIPIPILDDRARKIAGVPVRDFTRPITDSRAQNDIMEALKKITLNVKYKCPVSQKYGDSKFRFLNSCFK